MKSKRNVRGKSDFLERRTKRANTVRKWWFRKYSVSKRSKASSSNQIDAFPLFRRCKVAKFSSSLKMLLSRVGGPFEWFTKANACYNDLKSILSPTSNALPTLSYGVALVLTLFIAFDKIARILNRSTLPYAKVFSLECSVERRVWMSPGDHSVQRKGANRTTIQSFQDNRMAKLRTGKFLYL